MLPFASCFAYSPGRGGPVGDEATLLCRQLKAADPRWLAKLTVRVWLEASSGGCLSGRFGARVILIPVPGSAPAPVGPWVGERLASALRELGLAAAVWPLLCRRHAVRKSAFAPAGERPSVLEHYASFAIEGACPRETPGLRRERLRLTLVDDVITRGRTLLAAAQRLREAFPAADIRAFALLRTLGSEAPLIRLLEPCEGEVRWASGDARRVP